METREDFSLPIEIERDGISWPTKRVWIVAIATSLAVDVGLVAGVIQLVRWWA